MNNYIDPYSTPEQIKLEGGHSGAARMRRLGFPFGAGSGDAHGSIPATGHSHFADGSTTQINTIPQILPKDFVPGGFPTLNLLWNCTTNTGNVRFTVSVTSLVDGDTAGTILLSSTTDNAVPGTVDTLELTTISLTTIPEPNDIIALVLSREGAHANDTNAGQVSLYAVWLEYLAFF